MSEKYPLVFIEHALQRLRENNGNVKATAEELNLPRSVLTSWRDGTRRRSDATQAIVGGVGVPATDDRLASTWKRIAEKATEKAEQLIDGTKSLKEVAIVGAIGTDKYLLASGKPTSHQATAIEIRFAGGATSLKDLADKTLRGEIAPGPIVVSVEKPDDLEGEAVELPETRLDGH